MNDSLRTGVILPAGYLQLLPRLVGDAVGGVGSDKGWNAVAASCDGDRAGRADGWCSDAAIRRMGATDQMPGGGYGAIAGAE